MATHQEDLNVHDGESAKVRACRQYQSVFANERNLEHRTLLVLSKNRFGTFPFVKDLMHCVRQNTSPNLQTDKLLVPNDPFEFCATLEDKKGIISDINNVAMSRSSYVSQEFKPGIPSTLAVPEPLFWFGSQLERLQSNSSINVMGRGVWDLRPAMAVLR